MASAGGNRGKGRIKRGVRGAVKQEAGEGDSVSRAGLSSTKMYQSWGRNVGRVLSVRRACRGRRRRLAVEEERAQLLCRQTGCQGLAASGDGAWRGCRHGLGHGVCVIIVARRRRIASGCARLFAVVGCDGSGAGSGRRGRAGRHEQRHRRIEDAFPPPSLCWLFGGGGGGESGRGRVEDRCGLQVRLFFVLLARQKNRCVRNSKAAALYKLRDSRGGTVGNDEKEEESNGSDGRCQEDEERATALFSSCPCPRSMLKTTKRAQLRGVYGEVR